MAICDNGQTAVGNGIILLAGSVQDTLDWVQTEGLLWFGKCFLKF